MAEMDVVDLSPATLTPEEDRRRWAAEQALRIAVATTSSGDGYVLSVGAIDVLLEKVANALEAYAEDGTVTRPPPPPTTS